MAAKPSSAVQPETLPSSASPNVSAEVDPRSASQTLAFFKSFRLNRSLPDISNTDDFYGAFIRGFLKVDRIQRGRITCTVSVRHPITNLFETMHGGGVAAVAELMAIACARTVVAEDKELFLGELSISYLSGAPINAEVLADASVEKSGRNLTVIGLEFKLKGTGKLIYTARATFYNLPVAKL
ncbi:acyl-coenzyme A thioesterase 13-like [Senna tora]|uniref:Acyl-coenzyme A thioesterase 13-like n=1 Tax=Senna tora TaxID=362788 RepID=A0A834XIV3_9FABA|nr:acyl-coenzyme A thioesterase 13-like [Senna tora]